MVEFCTMEALFTVKLIHRGKLQSLDFSTIHKFMTDPGMPGLFEGDSAIDRPVTECTVYIGKKRITSLPYMTWEKLKDQVLSNSETILRARYDHNNDTTNS